MFLGVDLGTSSIKLLLTDDCGKVLDCEKASYSTFHPAHGCSEQRPEDWYRSFSEAMSRLGQRHDAERIKGLSFSGQMHGLVALDDSGAVVRPAMLWNDARAWKESDFLNTEIGEDVLRDLTANISYPGFTAPKIMWLRDNEREAYDRTAKLLLPKDYLAYRLTGVYASDVSDSSGTLLFDVKNRRYSEEMLDIVGTARGLLPDVAESAEIIGSVSPEAARRTGLAAGAKVIIGGGDQAVGAVGTGTVAGGDMSLPLGTSGVLFASCDDFRLPPNGGVHAFCHANGKYHLMCCTLAAAGSLEWWCKNILGESDFGALIREAEASDAGGLMYLPYLSGERSPINDSHIRGCFYGLDVSHGRAQVTRAVLEGVAYSLRDCLETIKERGVPALAKVIGGGSKSRCWLQIISDCLNLPLAEIDAAEGGAFGAALLAMTGCGVFPSVDAAAMSAVRERRRYAPDAEKSGYYDAGYARYKSLYDRLKGIQSLSRNTTAS